MQNRQGVLHSEKDHVISCYFVLACTIKHGERGKWGEGLNFMTITTLFVHSNQTWPKTTIPLAQSACKHGVIE